MSTSAEGMDPLREQANQLYWSSAETVDQLASRLGLSRSAVYAAVQPSRVGVACTSCGGPLAFTNRTNRAARLATCLECATVVTLEEVPEHGEGVAEAADGVSRWRLLKDELSSVPPERAAKIGGLAAIGVAVGAAAVKAFRDRR